MVPFPDGVRIRGMKDRIQKVDRYRDREKGGREQEEKKKVKTIQKECGEERKLGTLYPGFGPPITAFLSLQVQQSTQILNSPHLLIDSSTQLLKYSNTQIHSYRVCSTNTKYTITTSVGLSINISYVSPNEHPGTTDEIQSMTRHQFELFLGCDTMRITTYCDLSFAGYLSDYLCQGLCCSAPIEAIYRS